MELGIALTAGATTGNTRTWTYTISSAGTTDTGNIVVVGNMVAGVSDLAGNAVTGSTPAATGSFTADTTSPTATSVVISATGASGTLLNAGDVVTVTATYSEDVSGQPTAAPTLTIGTETGIALTAGTTTGNTRTWTYTISSTGTTDTGSIAVVGNMVAGVSDLAGNAVTGSTPAATGSFTADTTAPTLASTSPAVTRTRLFGTAGDSAGEAIALSLTFDGPVNGLTSGDNLDIFTVGGAGVSASWSGNAGDTTRLLTYTVAANQNGQVDISESALKTALSLGLNDAAGNAFVHTANAGNIPNIDYAGGQARYVLIKADPSLWTGTYWGVQDVEVMSNGVNVARGKTVIRSASASVYYWGGVADGQRDSGTFLSSGDNSTSALKEHLWFQIDLGSNTTINSINLFGTGSSAANTAIFVSANNMAPASASTSYASLSADSAVTRFFTASAPDANTGVSYSLFLPVIDTTAPTASLTTGASPNTANASVQSSEAGTAYLVKSGGSGPVTVTNEASITNAAGAKWNRAAITTANTATSLSLAGLEDGTYSLYTVDAAGNLSAVASSTYTVDSTAPTATLSAGTATSSGTATVQSSEIGIAYLVKTGGSSPVTVTNLASITGAADAKWNSVAITTASINTSLSLAGLEDGTYSLYTVDAAGNLSAAAAGSFTLDTITPMVLDLDGNGVRTTSVQRGILFDVLATGAPVRTGWTDGHDGLLVLDLNGDGQINDGRELFGNGTDTPNGKAVDGFAALAQYDLNHDGVIDSQDAVFAKLQVWVDANTDGVTQPSELKSLADLDVASLGLQAQVGTQIDNGNLLGLNASWTDSDGVAHDLVDVFFSSWSLQSWVEQATQRLDLAADPQANEVSVHRAAVLDADQSTLVVKTGTNDVVRLEESGWVATGSEVSVDGYSYGLWSNAGAHLWIDRNATVQQVL
jgi:hypothetical protein